MANGLKSFLFNPFALLFFTACLGIALGRVKIKKFCLGACGTLVVGLAVGWLVILSAGRVGKSSPLYAAASKLISQGVISKEFFNLFLILFVVSLGLISGKEVVAALRQYGFKFLSIGFLITLLGFATTTALIKTTDVNPYQLSGVYSGAMLSTPAFAVSLDCTEQQVQALEERYPSLSEDQKQKVLDMIDPSLKAKSVPSLNDSQKEALLAQAENNTSLGHSITYPAGVVLGILLIIFLPRIFGFQIEEERKKFRDTMGGARKEEQAKSIPLLFDMGAFSLTAFLGVALGSVSIHNFSLGLAGGSLIAALVLSAVGKVGPVNFRLNDTLLGVVKEIGLSLFLATVGLKYGYDVVAAMTGPGLRLLLLGLAILFLSVMAAFWIGRYVFRLDWLALSGAICGGITNTPVLGAAIDSVKSNEPAVGYGAVYPFALIFKIIFAILLLKVF